MRSGFCNFMHIKTISPDVKKRLRERRRQFVLKNVLLDKYFIAVFDLDRVHKVVHRREEIVVVDRRETENHEEKKKNIVAFIFFCYFLFFFFCLFLYIDLFQ